MERNLLRRKMIVVLALVGSVIVCFVFLKSGGQSFRLFSLCRKDLSDLLQASNIQNSTFTAKYTFEDPIVSSQTFSQTKHGSHLHKNWTILLTVNNAYFDFFINWYLAYRHLDINYSLIIVTEDELVYEKLLSFTSETVSVEKSGHDPVEKSAAYGSKDFSKLVSQRPTHILRHLQKGVNILYSDIDMVWLQNPFPYFTGNFDMWIELDSINNYCTGLMAIKSNANCISLVTNWEKSLKIKQVIDQTAFNRVVTNASINISVLDSSTFPTGSQYFDKYTDEQRKSAVVIHNNWIIGHDAKLERFKKFKIWFAADSKLP